MRECQALHVGQSKSYSLQGIVFLSQYVLLLLSQVAADVAGLADQPASE